MKVGLTVGKFMPLHRGHELLLEAAARGCDRLYILLDAAEEPIRFEVRKNWIFNFLAKNELIQFDATGPTNIVFIRDFNPKPDARMDENGTIIDEEFWKPWLNTHASYFADVTHVFTSDHYGGEIVNRINLRFPDRSFKSRWVPVDPDRELFNISASAIREDPRRMFKYLSDEAKLHLCQTIAVVGAESTGKSTVTKILAEHFGSPYAPEYGRTIAEARPDLDLDDFQTIMDMQHRFIRAAKRSSENGVCFADTEAITTELFAPIYLGKQSERLRSPSLFQKIDLFLVMAPTVPMVQDGTRILNKEQREKFHDDLLRELRSRGEKYVIVEDDTHEARTNAAIVLMEWWLTKPPSW